MNLIEKEIAKVNFIVDQFIDERNSVYENITNTITDKLKKVIDELAPKSQLTSINSIRKLKFYTFSPRVKEADSLKEKLIRNNSINIFKPIIEDDFQSDDGTLIFNVKNKLLEIDDLIGIKILTDLNTDCIQMYNLVNSPEFKSRAIGQSIELNEVDLKTQPQIMRNGLNIYKIRGKYDKYNFELQIKSKIISAWGDMEHSIFYKDYFVSPVRETSQSSMNHVGKLLYDIDDFLTSIRSANSKYKDNALELSFLQWFDENYNSKISSKLDNLGYRIDGISGMLYAVFSYLKSNGILKEGELSFSHFEFPVTGFELQSYVVKRNERYDLKILESVILSWIIGNDKTIEPHNIEEILKIYFETLKEAASKLISDKYEAYDNAEIKELLDNYHSTGLACDCDESLLLNLKKFDLFLKIRAFLIDISETLIDEEAFKFLLKYILVFLNNGKVEKVTALIVADGKVDIGLLKSSILLIKDEADKKTLKVDFNLSNLLQHLATNIQEA